VETPPGSIFRAVIASLSSAVLIWVIGLAISRNPQGFDFTSDAPAVLLAFPAVIAGWLGIDAPRDRLLEGTLIARLLLIGSACSALSASALYFFSHASQPMLAARMPSISGHPVSILGITEVSWGILFVIALALAVIAVYLWLVRTFVFAIFSSRSLEG
jgi:hypothetical protein